MTQNNQIRRHLESGKTLTPLMALTRFGCLRLGGRIFELRESGMDIKTEMIDVKGKRIAKYYL